MPTNTTPLQHRLERPSRPPQLDRSARQHLLDEKIFRGALIRERKRADRSNQPLGLLLVTLDERTSPSSDAGRAVVAGLMAVKRDTHIAGWFEGRRTVGLIVPEIPAPVPAFVHDLKGSVRQQLEHRLDARAIERLSIQVHAHSHPKGETAEGLPPVDPLLPRRKGAALYDGLKRMLDLAGSLMLLAILSPLFAVIAVLVRLTSPGPVFFRQVRMGQGMTPFTMLKFRTMHENAGHSLHHEFVTSFIKSGSQAQEAGRNGMFKITNDPRVTTVGRILRKTSLDELPQFWNVVRGEMSLVGPRPPLQYEVEQYQPWHCRRVLEAKPGITGLWQVAGRSRTTFDEMVRLDLRYAKACSLWTDLKILLATPAAVIVGKGAA
jgi:lipopolysaccharide/colanic/teichoic acid biosynthesis glycosyltransferase